jgi:glycosyltransferase involved in cell wall biosynthesis
MHVALLTQNCDLEIDLRPRAEGAALAREGHRVTLVGRTSQPEEVRAVTDPAVALALFRSPPEAEALAGQVLEVGWAFLATLRTLARIARRDPIDVVHASNPPDNAFLMAKALRWVQGYAPRFVFDQHDVGPDLLRAKVSETGAGGLAIRLAESLERRSFASADLTIFANRAYADRAAGVGLLQGSSAVVPNGWRLPEIAPEGKWRNGARHMIAYVGEIAAQDDVTHMIEAIAQLPQVGDVHLVVGGDGPSRGDAQARAEDLGLADRITWLGWMTDREEIASLVRSADVCVAPEADSPFNRISTFVKIIEYMSASAPVAAHRLPATEQLCGETVEYADDMSPGGLSRAIARLLDDPARADELGRQGRERFLSTVDWEATGARRLVEAYRDLDPTRRA